MAKTATPRNPQPAPETAGATAPEGVATSPDAPSGVTSSGIGTGAEASGESASPLQDPPKSVDDAEFEKAMNEPNRMPTPTEAELDAFDPMPSSEERAAASDLAAKIKGLVNAASADDPDERILFGWGNIKFTMGDLRLIGKYAP